MYIDTSLVMPYYSPEALSQAAERTLRSDPRPAVSDLVEVEFFSALGRKVRVREMSAADATRTGEQFLTADNGNSGAPDGHIDTVSVIDRESNPPRVIDRVVVGDAPEGFVIGPKGDIAVAVLPGGASVPKSAWFNTKRNGRVVVLKIDGKKVTKVGEVEIGGLPRARCSAPTARTSMSTTTPAATCRSSRWTAPG